MDEAGSDVGRIAEQLAAVLAAEPALAWVYLFGSFLREGRAPRDLDLAVMPKEGELRLLDLGRLGVRLTSALGVGVDVVDLSAAALPFVGALLTDRRVVLDRAPRRRHEWEATMALRWLDFRPVWERAGALRREALRARVTGSGP